MLNIIKDTVLWKIHSGLCLWKILVWFSFFVILLFGFGIRAILGSKKKGEFKHSFLLFCFLEDFVIFWSYFFLLSLISHLDLEFCLLEGVWQQTEFFYSYRAIQTFYLFLSQFDKMVLKKPVHLSKLPNLMAYGCGGFLLYSILKIFDRQKAVHN